MHGNISVESHKNCKICREGNHHCDGCFFCTKKGVINLSKDRQAGFLVFNQKKHINIPALTGQFYVVSMIVHFRCQTAYADIFDTAKSAMQQVYTDVAGIATVGAVVCAAVCLFLMNFSKSGKTVDESRAWLKRIIICWAALMTLGGIVTYMESIIPKSMFSA